MHSLFRYWPQELYKDGLQKNKYNWSWINYPFSLHRLFFKGEVWINWWFFLLLFTLELSEIGNRAVQLKE